MVARAFLDDVWVGGVSDYQDVPICAPFVESSLAGLTWACIDMADAPLVLFEIERWLTPGPIITCAVVTASFVLV